VSDVDSKPVRLADAATSSLPRNVKLLGFTSLINDIASEMIYPLMPQFLLGMLGGSKFHL
jgi:hypothetical protein